jgi:hypothetical protein
MMDFLNGNSGLVLLTVIVLFALSRILINVQSFPWGKKRKDAYEWQPDLSHNVHHSEQNNHVWGRHNNIHITEKSQEQRDEERRAYLREKDR